MARVRRVRPAVLRPFTQPAGPHPYGAFHHIPRLTRHCKKNLMIPFPGAPHKAQIPLLLRCKITDCNLLYQLTIDLRRHIVSNSTARAAVQPLELLRRHLLSGIAPMSSRRGHRLPIAFRRSTLQPRLRCGINNRCRPFRWPGTAPRPLRCSAVAPQPYLGGRCLIPRCEQTLGTLSRVPKGIAIFARLAQYGNFQIIIPFN
jgi:hypothetical protein